MATSVLTHTVTDPTGTPLAGVRVEIHLNKPAFRVADSSEVSGLEVVTTDANGAISVALERNGNNLSPGDTFYTVVEHIPKVKGGPRVWTPVVVTANTTLKGAVPAAAPVADPTIYLTQATADGRYALGAFTPVGGIAATTVHGAIAEVDAEKETPAGATAKDTAAINAHKADALAHNGTYVEVAGAARAVLGTYNAKDYAATAAQKSAFGNGLSKPLSGYYASLALAQAAYPNATDLTDQLDTVIVNRAIVVANAAGGGTVLVPKEPLGGGYVIGRHTVGVQAGGGFHLLPGVGLVGDDTKLLLTGNCDFIYGNRGITATATITADTTTATTVLTVASSTGIAVGDWVRVILGQAAYDAGEPDWWLFAKVTAVTGTSVSLDRPVNKAMVVASTAANRREVSKLVGPIEGITIAGFDLDYLAGTSPGLAEGGINLAHGWDIRIDNITAIHAGAGILVGQYLENVHGTNWRLRESDVLDAHASKGRGLTLSECHNVVVDSLHLTRFQRHAAFVESSCRAVRLRNVHLVNTHPLRGASEPLFGVLGDSELTVEGLHVTGVASPLVYSGGTPDRLRLVDSSWNLPSPPTDTEISFLSGAVRFDEDAPYEEIQTFTRTFLVNPTGVLGAANSMTLPAGYYRRVRLFFSNVTGINSVFVTSGNGANQITSLVAGAVNLTAQCKFPGAAGINGTTAKGLDIYLTGGGTPTPAGAWGWIEVEYWPVTTDIQQGFLNDERTLRVVRSPNGTLYGLTVSNAGVLTTEALV